MDLCNGGTCWISIIAHGFLPLKSFHIFVVQDVLLMLSQYCSSFTTCKLNVFKVAHYTKYTFYELTFKYVGKMFVVIEMYLYIIIAQRSKAITVHIIAGDHPKPYFPLKKMYLLLFGDKQVYLLYITSSFIIIELLRFI